MDATHVVILNCKFGQRQAHIGFKLKQTSRTYNIAVNHRRRILSSTGRHLARWNDKTTVLFDNFVKISNLATFLQTTSSNHLNTTRKIM